MTRTCATVILALTLSACVIQPASDPGPGVDPEPAPPRPEEVVNADIDAYLTGLHYDSRQVLAEQVGDTPLPAKALPDEVTDDGEAIVVVKQVKHRLQGNVDDIVILSPTHSVIWPGALVKVDQDLVRGTPTAIRGRRAPMWLSIDLPGIGGRGVFAVDDASHGNVQAAVDAALDWWNDHQYREGYVSQSRSKYEATMAYSAEQLAASLGLSVKSLQGSLAAQFQSTTTRTSKVAMALFKQVFYSVTFDPPEHPGSVFHPTVTLDDVKAQVSNETPPAYVSSVDYGRLLLLRIESSTATRSHDIEGAMRYLCGRAKATASYRSALAKSKVTLITIGGNAEVNARAVDATRIEDLHEVIQGKNALYSKANPGEPIAYTIRFLKDGRLAKIGYSTDYTELVCERYPHGWIGFRHQGAYVAKFYLTWTEGNQVRRWSSGRRGVGFHEIIHLKGNARNIHINAQALGFRWITIFDKKLPGPPNQEFVVKGTAFKPGYRTSG